MSGTLEQIPNDIEITSQMEVAGVQALEDQLLEGLSIEGLRPILVSAVFRAMSHARRNRD